MADLLATGAVQTVIATGGGTAFKLPQLNAAGIVTVYATGTFGGTSVKLQISPNNVDWFDAPPTALTAAGILTVNTCAFVYARVFLTGGTGISLSVTFVF